MKTKRDLAQRAMLLGIAILIPWAAGCSTVRTVPMADASDPGNSAYRYEVEELNENLQGYTATVRLADGSTHESMTLAPAPDYRLADTSLDSATWWSKDDERLATTWPGIESITIVSHARGTFDGLGIGFLTGALAGAIIGFSDGDDKGGFIQFSAEEKAMISGIALGVVGGVVGLIVGGAKGHTYTWEAAPQK